jgi:hypothetical protein
MPLPDPPAFKCDICGKGIGRSRDGYVVKGVRLMHLVCYESEPPKRPARPKKTRRVR